MLEAALAALFGLLIGSFLNVCIHRMPQEASVIRPRSHCPSCKRSIAWYDNIPLASYIVLRARCRYCGARIAWRYPAVEVLTAALFFLYVLMYGPTLAALKWCMFGASCVALLFTDLEALILPDEFTLGGLAVGFALSLLVPVSDGIAEALLWIWGLEVGPRASSLAEAVLGATLPSSLLWTAGWVYEKVRHREGLGFGDVKFLAMIGAFFGLQGALVTLLAGSVLGSVIGLLYIGVARKDPSTYQLPFGTFLAAAAVVVSLIYRPGLVC
jgi:leader peptidase (prepilin peptidase)/N-methyltransferase